MQFTGAQFRRRGAIVGLLFGSLVTAWRGEATSGPRTFPASLTTPRESELRLVTTPDLQQTDPRLSSGRNRVSEVACGAVAAANGLAFLAAHGFPALLPSGAPRLDPQIELVERLETARYLAITTQGANTTDLLRGLSNYIADCGYHCTRVEYQGNHTPIGPWNRCKTGDFPAPASLRRALEEPGSLVLLDIGWYRRDPDDATALRRTGGHWVLAVGSGMKGDRQEVFYIRNPESPSFPAHSPGSGITFHPADARWLVTAPRRWIKAAGYEEVDGASLPHRPSHRAVLDGLVIFEIGAKTGP